LPGQWGERVGGGPGFPGTPHLPVRADESVRGQRHYYQGQVNVLLWPTERTTITTQQERTMRFFQRWYVALVAVLVLSGCIKVDQTLNIAPDGSGTLEMAYGMSEQTLAQIEAMKQMAAEMDDTEQAKQAAAESPLDFDEEKIRQEFAAKNLQGIELTEVASEVRDGWKFMRIKTRFENLAALQQVDFIKDSGLKITQNPDGTYVLTQEMGSDEMEGEGAPEMDETMMEGMAAMFAGMRIAATVVVPGKILETNATEVEGNRASWIYDVDKDPRALVKLQQTKEMRLVFGGPLGAAAAR